MGCKVKSCGIKVKRPHYGFLENSTTAIVTTLLDFYKSNGDSPQYHYNTSGPGGEMDYNTGIVIDFNKKIFLAGLDQIGTPDRDSGERYITISFGKLKTGAENRKTVKMLKGVLKEKGFDTGRASYCSGE